MVDVSFLILKLDSLKFRLDPRLPVSYHRWSPTVLQNVGVFLVLANNIVFTLALIFWIFSSYSCPITIDFSWFFIPPRGPNAKFH